AELFWGSPEIHRSDRAEGEQPATGIGADSSIEDTDVQKLKAASPPSGRGRGECSHRWQEHRHANGDKVVVSKKRNAVVIPRARIEYQLGPALFAGFEAQR